MSIRTELKDPIAEKTTAKITAKVVDETGAGIPAGSLTTLTLTVYAEADPTVVVNSRNQQNVLNANDVTIDASGNLTYQMQPADNAIMDTSRSWERHVLLFEWSWGGGKAGKHEVVVQVINMAKVS